MKKELRWINHEAPCVSDVFQILHIPAAAVLVFLSASAWTGIVAPDLRRCAHDGGCLQCGVSHMRLCSILTCLCIDLRAGKGEL